MLQTALDNFKRAKQIIEKHKPDVPWRVRYDLFFESCGALLDLGQPHYALGEAQKAVNIAHREGAKDLKVQAMFSKATAALYGHDSGQMKTTLDEMEPLVADNMESLLGVVTLQTAAFLILLGDLPSALTKESEMNDLFRRAPNSAFYATAALFIGVSHRWRGDYKKCSEILEPLLPKLRASAPPISSLESTFFCGLAVGEEGLYQKAIQILQEGREFGMKAGERYSAPKLTNSLGWVYHELCLFDKAIEYNNLALESIKDLLGPGTSNLFEIESQTRINLAENYLMTGDWQKAREYLELVYENAKKPEYYFVRPRWKARCLLVLGELWLHAGDTDKAESFLSEIIEHQWTDQFPFKKYQVRECRLRSGVLSARGQLEEAETELHRALTQAKQLGNPTQLWKTHEFMGNLLLKQGKREEARAEFRAAAKVVHDIAEGLTDAALKERYLQSEPIQELFSQAEES
jgi:tetratricopeptide (TPR) repeat protein